MPPLVTKRKGRSRNGQRCRVCQLGDESLQVINAAIWDGTDVRTPNYRARGQEAFKLLTGRDIDVRTIAAHADHIEAGWRRPTKEDPQRYNEVDVFPSDYESLTDASAALGAKAINTLDRKIDRGTLSDRELVAVAKMGVSARSEQRRAEIASKQPQVQLTAIFGLASGHLAQLPESEAIDVTPERELRDEVHAEKRRLEAHARG